MIDRQLPQSCILEQLINTLIGVSMKCRKSEETISKPLAYRTKRNLYELLSQFNWKLFAFQSLE